MIPILPVLYSAISYTGVSLRRVWRVNGLELADEHCGELSRLSTGVFTILPRMGGGGGAALLFLIGMCEYELEGNRSFLIPK